MLTEEVDEDGKANFIYRILLFTSLVHFCIYCVISRSNSSWYCDKAIATKTEEPGFSSATGKRSLYFPKRPDRLQVLKSPTSGYRERFTASKSAGVCILSLCLMTSLRMCGDMPLLPYTSLLAWWLIQLRDTFFVFLTTKSVYCSGWFDGSSVPFSSVLFSFIDLPANVGMVSCKPSTI